MKRMKKKKLMVNVFAWMFELPYVVLGTLFLIYPLINSLVLSMYKKTIFSGYKFVGFRNFVSVFQDDVFIKSLLNTLYFAVVSTILYVVVSLLLAALFNRSGKLTYIMRSFVVAPMVLSVSVMGVIWKLLFSCGPGYKMINDIFGKDVSITTSPSIAMWVIILSTLWWTIGTNVIIFIAGMQQISTELYDAAKIDGATGGKIFFKITLPLLKPTITTVIILQTIASFQLYGQPYVITNGGPFNSTKTILMYIYDSFSAGNYGFSAAVSVLLMAMMLIVSIIEMILISRFNRESA